MTGVFYLAIAVFWGSAVCRYFFPGLSDMADRTYQGEKTHISRLFLLVPAWVYSGLIPMTWCVYLLAYLFRKNGNSMMFANIIVIIVFAVSGAMLALKCYKKAAFDWHGMKPSRSEAVFLLLVLALAVSLFWTTFRIEGDRLYVGLSVFSDFSPHLGMIRSFSKGNNFPTAYSHYAGEDIKYHFMFQFLVGNLEYLGMRLDLAFNIPSAIGFLSTFSLLYVLAVKITGKKGVGYLAALFFAFRSSVSVFSYLAELGKEDSVIRKFFTNSSFIGYSTHEDWGLWNLNVYCNQRHLAFTLGVLLLVLIVYLPNLYAMMDRLAESWAGKLQEESSPQEKTFLQEKNSLQEKNLLQKMGINQIFRRISFFLKESMFAKEGWQMESSAKAVAAGLLLGAIAFWNGAVTIAALLVLFVLAVVSDHRLEFLVTAMIAVLLSVMQSLFFINGSAVSTTFYYGFIAENRTFFGVLDYIYRLVGFLPFVVAAAFVISDAGKRYLTIAFAAPFVFAFHVSLTPDVTVNHKYIMISLMLLGILEGYAVVRLWEQKKALMRTAAVCLTIMLTITGIFDYITVLNRNQRENNLAFDRNNELMLWIQENANAQDIFLTANYALNYVVLGGAMLFDGWQYFAWSAGYDTAQRDRLVKQMYEAESVELLKKLTEENRIRFIIVDNSNRTSSDYDLREDVIEAAFRAVYTSGEGAWKTTVYDVHQPLSAGYE